MTTTTNSTPQTARDLPALLRRFQDARDFTLSLCASLSAEDCAIQSMPDVSPTRWHLAHTSWFFETFVLPASGRQDCFHPAYRYLFNSYYNAVGEQYPRSRRGLLSRPSLQEIRDYRRWTDERVSSFLETCRGHEPVLDVVELGIQHEQQHQELLLTDIKHVFSVNPLWPAYRELPAAPGGGAAEPLRWHRFEPGLAWIGHGGGGFAFDNESPRHRHHVPPFELADRLVTNAEYREFLEEGGYSRPELWLSDGWQKVQEERWQAPLHWVRREDRWCEFTLGGLGPLEPAAPVCHVSLYEADAYARWREARLPTEEEWECACPAQPVDANFVEQGRFHPRAAAPRDGGPRQMWGDVWEWTGSAYSPYPGFRPSAGAIGEYNGKFMCNQVVLRGGSCATPANHIRPTYRNFFPPAARWQFSGIRLARDPGA